MQTRTYRNYIYSHNNPRNYFKTSDETFYINSYFAPLFFGNSSADIVNEKHPSQISYDSFLSLKIYLEKNPCAVKYQRRIFTPATVLFTQKIENKLFADYWNLIDNLKKLSKTVPLNFIKKITR